MRTGMGQFEGPLVWTRFGGRFEYYYGFRGWKANQIIFPYSTKAIGYIIYLGALINQPALMGYKRKEPAYCKIIWGDCKI